jgi:hypothetical protein
LPHDEDDEFTNDEGRGRGKGKKGGSGTDQSGDGGMGHKGRKGRGKKKSPQESFRAPDLPVVVVTENHRRSNPPIRVIPDDTCTEVRIKASLYRATPESHPLEYEFKAWKGTVSPQIDFYDSNSYHSNRQMLNASSLRG